MFRKFEFYRGRKCCFRKVPIITQRAGFLIEWFTFTFFLKLFRHATGRLTHVAPFLHSTILCVFVFLASRKPDDIVFHNRKRAAKEKDRLDLKSALISTQESAALQILLEVCLPTEAEKKVSNRPSVYNLYLSGKLVFGRNINLWSP